ncbi:hypothetical protein [Erwinia amylovora]|uniref:hypothetical protein n=1 Tax=Erwinia amylovora TaxID=552 RepID=UPI003BFA694D
MRMDLSNLAEMTPSDETTFFTIFDAQLEHDAGEEARANLKSGVAIYYADKNTPDGCVIKEYPNGRKELVSFMTGEEKLVVGSF